MTKAKNPIKVFKKYLGEIIAIIGSGILIYNVFNFSYDTTIASGTRVRIRTSELIKIDGVAYFYTHDTLLWIAIGAMLIVSGILIIRNKNRK